MNPRPALAEALNSHAYPRLLYQAPRLLRVLHGAVFATTLRTWYVRRALRRLLGTIKGPFRYLDAGCGAGDFLLPQARRHPGSAFVGIDRIADNIALCSAYGRRRGLDNLTLHQGALEHYTPDPPVDLIVCVTVLQYVTDDRRVLRRFFDGLRTDGRLLLYVPVRNERWFAFYARQEARHARTSYDGRQARQRIYTPEAVRALLHDAGFEITSMEQAYGTPGKIAYELYATLLAGAGRAPWPLGAFLLPPLVLLCYPLLFVLMAADYLLPQRRGNGLLVTARKAAA